MTKEARLRDILAEATRFIGERGYSGFKVQELAQRCGLTNAGLLHYCGSKEQLLLDVLRDYDRSEEKEIDKIFKEVAPGRPSHDLPLDVILDVLHAMVSRNASQPDRLRLLVVIRAEALNAGHPAHLHFVARDEAVLDLFEEMVASHVSNPRETARQIVGLMLGLELQWLQQAQKFDIAAAWDLGVRQIFARL